MMFLFWLGLSCVTVLGLGIYFREHLRQYIGYYMIPCACLEHTQDGMMTDGLCY